MTATMAVDAPPKPATGAGRIELTDIAKVFAERHGRTTSALDGVSLAVEAGEFLTLLGPSGSGKSTLLGVLAGLVAPTRGTVRLDDRDITDTPPRRRHMGVVFQDYALFPHMTVWENVAYPLKVRKVGRDETRRRVGEVLGTVRLDGYESRSPSQLSGGQRQRVAIARALVFRPAVLLMDEPLGALDKALRSHMQLEIRAIQQAVGTTCVYVTHDQDEAIAMSDRIAVINDGRSMQVGTPDQIYQHPNSEFVARFIGQISLAPGRVVDRQARIVELRSGQRLVASTLPKTDDVLVGARPESIRVDVDGAPYSIPATVTSLRFAGAYQEVEADLDDGVSLCLHVPVHTRLAPGERCSLSIAPDDVICVRPQPPDPQPSTQGVV